MAIMNLEYIKQLVQIYKSTAVPFEEALEVIIRGYTQLNEDEQKDNVFDYVPDEYFRIWRLEFLLRISGQYQDVKH